MSKLALLGGKPVRTKLFPAYNPIGKEEGAAVARVMKSGNLSQYIGAWHPDFHGGPEVRRFEGAWARSFGVQHALAVKLIERGMVRVNPLITHRFTLKEIQKAFDTMQERGGMKVIVNPHTE